MTTQLPWGIPNGEPLNHRVAVESSDNERDTYPDTRSSICGLDQYKLLKETITAPPVDLTGEDLESVRSDASYQDLLTFSAAQGFTNTNYTSRRTLSDGTEIVSTFLIKPGASTLESIAFLTRYRNPSGVSSGWMLYELTNSTISMYDREGGILFNIDNNSFNYLGSWNNEVDQDVIRTSEVCPRGVCRGNCWKSETESLIMGCLPQYLIKNENWAFRAELVKTGYDLYKSRTPCVICGNPTPSIPKYGYKWWEACKECATPVLERTIDQSPLLLVSLIPCLFNILDNGARCELLCRNQGTFADEVKEFVACNPGKTRNSCGKYWNLNNYYGEYFSSDPVLIKETCNSACEWQQTDPQWCKDGSCLSGSGENDSECGEGNENGDDLPGTVTAARDPNIKTGKEGRVTAGERLEYRLEFENEGEGIAYGVYFTDTLDGDLDDSTLSLNPVYSTIDQSIIAPPGTYNPATRTITWLVGEVGSKKGGYTNYSVTIRNNAPDDTMIINYGTVYFPSVPETTRTNGIISIVGYNRLPVMEWMSYYQLNPTEPFGLKVNATDDDDDSLTYSAMQVNGSALPNGAAIDEQTGVFNWTPASNQAGLYELQFSVSDWRGSVSQNVTP